MNLASPAGAFTEELGTDFAIVMTMLNVRVKFAITLAVLGVITISAYSLRNSFSLKAAELLQIIPQPSGPTETTINITVASESAELKVEIPPPVGPDSEMEIPETEDGTKYKPQPRINTIVDNFPLARAAHSAEELPPIPPWNQPPSPHVPEKTPLFIGFTRNWRLLQQTVVSYITAGWPPEDIFIIENTGTMKSNELGLLSIQNPFFLNHTRLRMFGVNVVISPTLLSFSQLQNYYIWLAIQNNFTTYFYGHMDVIALPYEDRPDFKSIYQRAVDTLRLATSPGLDPNSADSSKSWAARFFSYDRLTLVNREAYESIGGWDTTIPYYFTDCDMHDRLKMYGFEYNGPDIEIGNFADVAGSLDDLLVLYRKKSSAEASFDIDNPGLNPQNTKRKEKAHLLFKERSSDSTWISDELGSASYKQLSSVVDTLARLKISDSRGRNTWQARQNGGKGDPYYRDSDGFERAIQMLTQTGREIYAEKWGHQSCGLMPGRKAGDEWRVEHDWE